MNPNIMLSVSHAQAVVILCAAMLIVVACVVCLSAMGGTRRPSDRYTRALAKRYAREHTARMNARRNARKGY